MLILAIVAAVSMPVGHATNNVHTFFTNATTVGTCGTLCSGLAITVTGLSTPGITWDGSARTTLAPASCAMTATEWIGHTTATLSSVTTTITLSSTPIGASAQIAAFSGSEDPSGTFNPSDKA